MEFWYWLFSSFNTSPYFVGSDNVCQSSIQSDNSIESYATHDLLQTDRQTDTFVKTLFSDSGGLKTLRFDENFESHFSHKTNTFSYDENVKMDQKFENACYLRKFMDRHIGSTFLNCEILTSDSDLATQKTWIY